MPPGDRGRGEPALALYQHLRRELRQPVEPPEDLRVGTVRAGEQHETREQQHGPSRRQQPVQQHFGIYGSAGTCNRNCYFYHKIIMGMGKTTWNICKFVSLKC
mgnify:CR=1 FL=1